MYLYKMVNIRDHKCSSYQPQLCYMLLYIHNPLSAGDYKCILKLLHKNLSQNYLYSMVNYKYYLKCSSNHRYQWHLSLRLCDLLSTGEHKCTPHQLYDCLILLYYKYFSTSGDHECLLNLQPHCLFLLYIYNFLSTGEHTGEYKSILYFSYKCLFFLYFHVFLRDRDLKSLPNQLSMPICIKHLQHFKYWRL